jgi:hypothetical protein
VSEIDGLIERLRKATEPHRELDHEIYRLERAWQSPLEPRRLTTDTEYTPLYTASIDAALTLVPEGWRVSHIGANPLWAAALMLDCNPKTGRPLCVTNGASDEKSATPAIALCIAAFEARKVVGAVGIEPTASAMSRRRSPAELSARQVQRHSDGAEKPLSDA